MSTTYNADQIVDKTLIADMNVPIYDYPSSNRQPIGTIKTGQTVGIVYSWIAADPTDGRNQLWWQFYPAAVGGKYYYAPHEPGYYNIKSLSDQGSVTTEELHLQTLPWYERLIRKYGIYILGAAVAAAAVKGYLSKPKQNS